MATRNNSLKEFVDNLNLPDSPGVYFFRDGDTAQDPLGNIVYIGKATSLRSRVKSYFNPDLINTRGLRLVNMILAAKTVTYEETDSVLEALLLENRLIKQHQPVFNSKEKDNKTYSCIVITKENYPRVLSMRIREFEKRFTDNEIDAVYGPFISAQQAREILRLIRKVIPFRDRCEEGQDKPCFNAQLGLCPGCCVGRISREEYKKNIRNIKNIFAGRKNEIKKSLEQDMKRYAKEEKFELAAQARNSAWALDHINDVSLIANDELTDFKNKAYRIEAYDVAHISGTSRVGVMVVVTGGRKDTDEYKKFKLDEKVNDDYAGIREMLIRRFAHKDWGMPDLIVFDGGEAQKHTGDVVLAELGVLVQTCSVVKDDRHKAKDILGNKKVLEDQQLRKAILLANGEAHRFAISYHRKTRAKRLLAK